MIRVAAVPRAPLGAIFGAAGACVAAGVALLGLDRLPWTLCTWKMMTGLPCPTCGTTRALSCLAHLDLAGAFAMNPLTSSAALAIAAWAVTDLALLPSRRGLVVELAGGPARAARLLAVSALVANWVYLVAVGR